MNTSFKKLIQIYKFSILTKIKFILVTDPATSNDEIEKTFNKIYNLYSDTVSKNPFYDLDMPIRLDNFDIGINNIFKI